MFSLLMNKEKKAIVKYSIAWDKCSNLSHLMPGPVKVASMNVAHYDLAYAEVNGMVYTVGSCRTNGKTFSSVEMYNPDQNKWTLIESLRHPRWGCFACGFGGKNST